MESMNEWEGNNSVNDDDLRAIKHWKARKTSFNTLNLSVLRQRMQNTVELSHLESKARAASKIRSPKPSV